MNRKEIFVMKKPEEKALIFSTLTSVLLSLVVVIGSVAVIAAKLKKDHDYNEKWRDYDECGI